KRTVSEHVWSLNLSTIGADMVLCPSPFEGFDEDFVSTTQRMGQFGVAAIVHDLFPYHDPCRHIGSKLACDWYNTKLSEITSLNILFANSDFTRRDVIGSLGYPANRIDTISAAVDMNVFAKTKAGDEGDLLDRLGVRSGFILYAGSLETRKNVDVLLRAFSV